jgi:hypothetical protein
MTRKSALLSVLLTLFAASFARAEVKDACTLISTADAQAVLGEPVNPGKFDNRSSGTGDGSACTFRGAAGGALSAKKVSLTLRYSSNDVRGSAPGMAESMRSNGYQNVHPVAGVGDAAIWGSLKMLRRTTCELTVLKGKAIVLIVLIEGLPDDATTLDRATHLALSVLPRT